MVLPSLYIQFFRLYRTLRFSLQEPRDHLTRLPRMRTVSSCLEDVGEFPPPDPLKLCQRCHVRQQRGWFFPHMAKSSLVYTHMDHVVTLSKLMLPWPLPKTWEFLMRFQVLCRVTRIPQQKPTIPSQSSSSHAFLGFLMQAQSLQIQCCVAIHPQKISFSQIFQAEPQTASASERLGSWALMPPSVYSMEVSLPSPHPMIPLDPSYRTRYHQALVETSPSSNPTL